MHVKMRFSNMNSKTVQNQITYQKTIINENLKYFQPSTIKKQKSFLDEITTSLTNKSKSMNYRRANSVCTVCAELGQCVAEEHASWNMHDMHKCTHAYESHNRMRIYHQSRHKQTNVFV